MTDNPLSKEAQLGRSPGGNRICPRTGKYKRSCTCSPCLGARNQRKGKRKQREARKALHIDVPTVAAGGQEESWRGLVRVEVKSGVQVKACATRFLQAETQSETARPIGDNRPFCAILMPDQWGKDGVFQCRLSQLREVVEALAAQWGYHR